MKALFIVTCGVVITEAVRGEIAANLRCDPDSIVPYIDGSMVDGSECLTIASPEVVAGWESYAYDLRWLDKLAPGSLSFAEATTIGVHRREYERRREQPDNRPPVFPTGVEFVGLTDPSGAESILLAAAQHMRDRASARDQAGGERSMARVVATFNALTGRDLSERDGWAFMVALKLGRAYATPTGTPDDYQDGAAYMGLMGECASR